MVADKSELPSQLSVTETPGAAGVVLGAGDTELLASLVHPFTVWVTVSAVVVVTERGLPLPPSLHTRVAPFTSPVAVIVDVPSQLSTFPSVGAAGFVFGAGVMELLDPLVHPLTVCVTVRAVVEVTVRGLPLPPSLQVSVAPAARPVAVTVDVPSQLSTFPNTGAEGVVFGAGVTELLTELVHPLSDCVTVRAVVELTVRGFPLPPSLQISVAPLTSPVAVIVDVPSQLSTLPKIGAAGVVCTISDTVELE